MKQRAFMLKEMSTDISDSSSCTSLSYSGSFNILIEGDTVGILYDFRWDCLKYDDDGGVSSNFLIQVKLNAGEIYNLGVRWYSSSYKGDISVSLTKKEIPETVDL